MESKAYIKRINELYENTKRCCYVNNKIFNVEDYEWELGIDVMKTLIASYHANIIENCATDSYHTAFGIKIRINVENGEVIKLWKETE